MSKIDQYTIEVNKLKIDMVLNDKKQRTFSIVPNAPISICSPARSSFVSPEVD